MPSLCALCYAVRSLRWPWNLCENLVLRSAQALRHCRLCCSGCIGVAKCCFCVVQFQPLLLVADSYVVFERRRDPNASIVVAVAMPRPTRMSPQVRPRPQPAMSQPVCSPLWKVLESPVAQHRLAAVRRRRHPIFPPANASLAQQHAAHSSRRKGQSRQTLAHQLLAGHEGTAEGQAPKAKSQVSGSGQRLIRR